MTEVPKSIAVVDDDESMCKALGRLLKAGGYRVQTFPSGEAFLADDHHAAVDFLVLDVQFGGMSGFDLRERLVEEGHVPPIAFITAHDEPETRDKAWKGGCVAYLRKPFPGQRLLDAIRTALAARRPM